ncbi:Nif3-like dinuclear metal center hexameric protein [Peptostreptococcus equinus]|uniref:GTP cyclohydrolase 1 type 2 homolog n=1 Tax=Peptostreptococcus equinus TaxID=3003601 RepID=A0ABY7JKW0_9FIRM|nr:Nif3-like dinuclear metal center hexameric protein [Peptostreptococcus sp. CBA3647]WAW13989.1 Nif3-like dinuclear metal center hexameric protein [Peptostreptococcus sp. CBA3647]
MKLKNVVEKIEKTYPEFLQYDWDNSGLNIGDPNSEIKKVLVCLDINENLVNEAIEKEIDLIISHHPFLFSKINSIVFNNKKTKSIQKLIKNDISVYCMHTNFDVAKNGLNDYLIELFEKQLHIYYIDINIKSISILESLGSNPNYLNGENYGLGRIVNLDKEMKIEEILELVSKALDIKSFRLIGNKDSKVGSFSVLTGSGADYFQMSKSMGADLIITGDSKYHIAMDSLDIDMNIGDFGHYGTEIIFSDLMKKFIENNFSGDLICFKAKSLEDPFTYFNF